MYAGAERDRSAERIGERFDVAGRDQRVKRLHCNQQDDRPGDDRADEPERGSRDEPAEQTAWLRPPRLVEGAKDEAEAGGERDAQDREHDQPARIVADRVVGVALKRPVADRVDAEVGDERRDANGDPENINPAPADSRAFVVWTPP